MIRPSFTHLGLRRHRPCDEQPPDLPRAMQEIIEAQVAANAELVADVQALAVFLEARRAVNIEAAADQARR
jgi:hypothetical protein